MIYAIGDIHGQRDHLERLIGRITKDAAARNIGRPRLVFLGDYGDRGTESKGVYDYISSEIFLATFNVTFIMGNHEHMLLAAEQSPHNATRWLTNGGAEFIESYGFRFGRASSAMLPEFFAAFPTQHRIFLERTRLWHAEAGYLFVHAGIDPAHPNARDPDTLLWIREPFLSCVDDWTVTVVHGHTANPSVVVLPNRIGVDTGCGLRPNNALSAVVLGTMGDPLRIISSSA